MMRVEERLDEYDGDPDLGHDSPCPISPIYFKDLLQSRTTGYVQVFGRPDTPIQSPQHP